METWLPILVALAPTYLVRFSVAGVPTTLLEVLIYVVAIATVVTKSISIARVRTQLTPMWWWGIGLVLFGMLIGLVVTQDKHTALGLAKAFIVDPLLVFFLIVGSKPRDDHNLVLWLTLSATVVSVISLVAWKLHAGWAVADDGRLLGLFGVEANASPNYLAMFLAPITAASIAWLGTPPWTPKRWQTLLGVSIVINLVAIAATESRAAIATAILGGIIGIVVYHRRSLATRPYARSLGVVAVLAMVMFGIALVQPDFALSGTNGGRIASSNNIRWEIWNTTSQLIDGQPIIGLGLGDYQQKFGKYTQHWVNYPEYITPWAHTPHNLFLNYWVQLSFFGMAGLVLLLVAAFRRLWVTNDQLNAAILVALLSTIVLHGLVDTPAWKNDLALLFWAVLAATAALRTARSNARA